MFFPFMDYGAQTFQIRNNGTQIFTAPYRCMVVLSDIKMDDSQRWNIQVLDLQIVQSGGRTDMQLAGYTRPSVQEGDGYIQDDTIGAYILRAGQRLSIGALDDFDVTINYFRLPEL